MRFNIISSDKVKLALTMVGALAVAKKAAVGASIGVTVFKDQVEAIVGPILQ